MITCFDSVPQRSWPSLDASYLPPCSLLCSEFLLLSDSILVRYICLEIHPLILDNQICPHIVVYNL
jgi:hypothetical protein